MVATVADVRFAAPSLAAVPDAEVQQALDYAVDFIPPCLTGKAADRAQVFYACWLLTDRLRQQANADSGMATLGGVKSYKEGDLQVTFAASATGENGGVYDPGGWYARWLALARICGGGTITVSRYGNGPCC